MVLPVMLIGLLSKEFAMFRKANGFGLLRQDGHNPGPPLATRFRQSTLSKPSGGRSLAAASIVCTSSGMTWMI